MRRFRLINSKGDSYDITTKDAFFHDPEGLGFQRDDTYHRVGSRYILANSAPSQGEIKGKLNFISSDPYADYREFLEFCNYDLQLEYEAGMTKSQYKNKGELAIAYNLAGDGSYIGYYDLSTGIFTALYRKVFYEDYADSSWEKLVDGYTYEIVDDSEYFETSPVDEGWYIVTIKSLTGSVVNFSDAVENSSLDSLEVTISASQDAAQDDSWPNVRPISGCDGLRLYLEEQYDPTAEPILNVSWPSEAGTVYGGSFNAVTGVLTVTYKKETFTGDSSEYWNRSDHNGGSYYSSYRSDMKRPDWPTKTNEGWCDLFPVLDGTLDSFGVTFGYISNLFIYFNHIEDTISGISSVEDWKTWLASNNVTVVYPLDTPIVYQLTPNEITTLAGENTIWSSTGDVTVGYSSYTLSEDTEINPEQVYYELYPEVYEAIYTTDWTEEERQATSPEANGWYEWSGDEDDNSYILSEDTEVQEGKQYYELQVGEYVQLYWPNLSPEDYGYYVYNNEYGYVLTHDSTFDANTDYYFRRDPVYQSDTCGIYECEVVGENEPQIQNGSVILCNGLDSLTYDAETAIDKKINGVCCSTDATKIQLCLLNTALNGLSISEWIDKNQPQFVYKLSNPIEIPYPDGMYNLSTQYDMVLTSDTIYSDGSTRDNAELSATYRKLDGTVEQVAGNQITLEDCVLDTNIQKLSITPSFGYDGYAEDSAWFAGCGHNLVPTDNRVISGVYEIGTDTVIPETEIMRLSAGQQYQYAIQYEVENATSDGFYEDGPRFSLGLIGSGAWTEQVNKPIVVTDANSFQELSCSFYPIDWIEQDQTPENPKPFYSLENLDIIDSLSYSFLDISRLSAISTGSGLDMSIVGPGGYGYVEIDQNEYIYSLINTYDIDYMDASPVEEGWYVKNYGEYSLSVDTSIIYGVSYYKYVDPSEISPRANGWRIRENGEYVESTDTTMQTDVTYYEYQYTKPYVRIQGTLTTDQVQTSAGLFDDVWIYLKNTLAANDDSEKYTVVYETKGYIRDGSVTMHVAQDYTMSSNSILSTTVIPSGTYDWQYSEMSMDKFMPFFSQTLDLDSDLFGTMFFEVQKDSLAASMDIDLIIYPMITMGNEYIYQIDSGGYSGPIVENAVHTIDWSESIEPLYGAEIDLVTGTIRKTWECIESYAGEELPGRWLSSMEPYNSESTPTIGAQVLFELESPIIYEDAIEPLYDFSSSTPVNHHHFYARPTPTISQSSWGNNLNASWNIRTKNIVASYAGEGLFSIGQRTIMDLEENDGIWSGSGYKESTFSVDHDLSLYISSTQSGLSDAGATINLKLSVISEPETDPMNDMDDMDDESEEIPLALLYLDEPYENVRDLSYPISSIIYYDSYDYQKFYRDVRISKIEKTEIDLYGTLEIDLTLKCLSPWMSPFRLYIENEILEAEPFVWSSHHSSSEEYDPTWNIIWGSGAKKMSFSIKSNSGLASPVLMVIPGPIVNPKWFHYLNGSLISDGACNVSVSEDQYLIISSFEDEFSIKVYSNDGSFLSDVYQQCDFSKDLFIFLRYGNNLIQISDEGGNSTSARVEGSLYYESV